VAVHATSCGTSGRELRDPAPGATAPPRRSSTTTTTTAPLAPIGLSIVSPAWAPGEPIPTTYSCDGAGESPPITVGGSPGAAELVVIATDPDAAGRVHWVVAGIDPSGAQIPADATPPGAVTGRNTAGDAVWEPLCPPTGETHTYEFTLYALAEPSGIGESTSAEEALGVVGAESTSAAVLTGTYRRRG
jgi:Raf kinase inhibitor-like YbhB/YbcL family protein